MLPLAVFVLLAGEDVLLCRDRFRIARIFLVVVVPEPALVAAQPLGQAFRNRAHGGLNMVYRRGDGNIGWIDPRGNRGS